MLTTDATLYLPLSEQVLDAVLDEREPLEAVLARLAVPQIAALIVLRCAARSQGKGGFAPGRILAETISHGNARIKQEGSHAFVTEVLQILDREQIRNGYELLAEHRIELMDDKELAHRTYLTAEGNWDSSFTERHRTQLLRSRQRVELRTGEVTILTGEQTKIYQEVRAQTDDHLHVQGYAGTGKSYLIKSLLSLLGSIGARTMVLAERKTQLDALIQGIDYDRGVVFPMTFDALIDRMAPADLTAPTYLRMRRTSSSRSVLPDDLIIRHLGIYPSGKFSSQHVVKVVRATVWNFCHQGEHTVCINHIPRHYAVALDDTTRQVVLHHATQLWEAILLPPSRDFTPPLRAYHRVKWATLNGLRTPDHYTHVLIDECHDLSKPMLQILDASRQAVISLGDEYQNLKGLPQYRTSVIRQRQVSHSVRSGRALEGIVNPIIQSHPGETKLPFHGNPFSTTQIITYNKAEVPKEPTVILVTDFWGLFEWAQRLAAEKIDFQLLSDPKILSLFVKDCIELKQHGTRPRHGELFRYESWDALASHYNQRPGFRRIESMLNKDYTAQHWAETASRFVTRSDSRYALGLIEDVRNQEFESIMLTPDVISWAWDMKHIARAAASSALYVAVTRTLRRLVIPDSFREWIDDVGAKQ